MTTSRPIFLGYARLSWIDPKNRREIESTDRQVARLQAWAAAEGVTLELYAEPEGWRSGGSTTHRPAYREMLQRLRSAAPGDIAGIVTTDIDRAGRLERDMHDLFDEVVRRGLRLIVLDEPSLNLESTDGRFLAGLKVLLAAQERRRMSDRTKRALAHKQDRGYHVGQAPFGYRYTEGRGEMGTIKVLTPDPVNAERLRMIFEKYVTNIGIDAVARWANAHGWPSQRGNDWTGAAIGELVRSVPVYRGFIARRGGRAAHTPVTWQAGNHPPIIDEALAQAVERVRLDRSLNKRAGRVASIPYPLVHLATCTVCGSRLVGASRFRDDAGALYDVPRFYYRCLKRRTCDTGRMPALALEAQVWNVLDRFRADLRDAASRDGRIFVPPPRPLPEPSTAGSLRAEMDRLTLIFQKGRITEEKYDHDYAVLERRLAQALASVETIGTPADPLGLLAVEKIMTEFDDARASGDRQGLGKIARLLVEQVEVDHGTVVKVRLVPALEETRRLLEELR